MPDNNIKNENREVKLDTEHKTIFDNLDNESDAVKFWKTPSSTRIVQGGSIMTLLDILGSVFFTVYLMIVAQQLDTEEAALIAVIDTLSLLLKFFAVLGFTGVGSKMVSEYLVRDMEQARFYGAASSKYNFMVTGIPLISLSIILAIFNRSANPLENFAYIALVVITIFDRLRSCVNIYVIGYKRYDLYAYSYYIPWGVRYIFSALFAYFGNVYGILATFMISEIVSFFLSLVMYKKVSDFPLSDIFAWKKGYHVFISMFTFNFLYSLANLIFALVTTTLLISLGESTHVLTNQEVVALYTISTMTNLLINVFEIVVPIMVSISEGHSLKNPRLIKNYTMLCVKFPVLASIAIFTFYMIFGADIIGLFYGTKNVVMGVLILICLVPSYIAGAFASRYDNIIAGIGRPEVVILPWILTFVITVSGIFLSMLLPDIYLFDYIQVIKGVPINYGITLKFLVALLSSTLGLVVCGTWITKICLKVLGVKIPRSFFLKPVLTAGVVLLILLPFITIVPIKDWILGINEFIGGYVYVMLLAVIGIFLFLFIGILFDVVNKEDGIFWIKIIEGFGPVAVFFSKPFITLAKKLLPYQIKKLKTEPIHWISKTDRDELEKEQLFKVKITPMTIEENIEERIDEATRSLKGAPVFEGKTYSFKINIYDIKKDLYDFIFYAKVNQKKLDHTLIYLKEAKIDGNIELILNLTIPKPKKYGVNELKIIGETYQVALENIEENLVAKKLFDKGLWTYFDYRIRWVHEEEFFINIIQNE